MRAYFLLVLIITISQIYGLSETEKPESPFTGFVNYVRGFVSPRDSVGAYVAETFLNQPEEEPEPVAERMTRVTVEQNESQ